MYFVLATQNCNLILVFTMNTTIQPTRQNQTLHKAGQCLYRSDHSGVYYAVFKRGGKQVKRSLKTTEKELAKRKLEVFRRKVARLNTGSGSKMLFAEYRRDDKTGEFTKELTGGLAQRWLDTIGGTMKPSSRKRRITAVNSLSPFFKTTTVRSITESQVEQWAAIRSKQAAARTFNIERETLMQVLNYATREGLLLDNPAAVTSRMKQPQPKIVIPTKDQFKTMLDFLRKANSRYQHAANLCELLAYSGCRLREATAMTWGDVNFGLHNFTVTGGDTGTKNHEARTIPLFPALDEFLLRLRTSLPQSPEPTDRIIPINDAKKAIGYACRKTKLPHFHHHSLRHFFCSNAIEAGVDFKAIAGWLGHKDGGILVAKTYGHLRDEHSNAMAKRMTFTAATEIKQPDNVIEMAAAATN